MAVLFIDTTDNTKVIIGLTIDGKEDKVERPMKSRSSQEVLPLIDELLQKHHLSQKDLTEVKVNSGPGSFTGVRVGVAIANAVAFALEIPINKTQIVNGKTLVEPTY